MNIRKVGAFLLRGLNAISDHIERHMPPVNAPPGYHPHASRKVYRSTGSGAGMVFLLTIYGVFVWGFIIVVLAHFW